MIYNSNFLAGRRGPRWFGWIFAVLCTLQLVSPLEALAAGPIPGETYRDYLYRVFSQEPLENFPKIDSTQLGHKPGVYVTVTDVPGADRTLQHMAIRCSRGDGSYTTFEFTVRNSPFDDVDTGVKQRTSSVFGVDPASPNRLVKSLPMSAEDTQKAIARLSEMGPASGKGYVQANGSCLSSIPKNDLFPDSYPNCQAYAATAFEEVEQLFPSLPRPASGGSVCATANAAARGSRMAAAARVGARAVGYVAVPVAVVGSTVGLADAYQKRDEEAAVMEVGSIINPFLGLTLWAVKALGDRVMTDDNIRRDAKTNMENNMYRDAMNAPGGLW